MALGSIDYSYSCAALSRATYEMAARRQDTYLGMTKGRTNFTSHMKAMKDKGQY